METHAEDLRALDRRHHFHPFTDHAAMHQAGTRVLVEGRGCRVRDAEGRWLLDALAGLWCVNVGYDCEEIVVAVSAQMRRLPFYPAFFNSTTEPPVLVAEFLARKAPPGIVRTIFSGSGSEANETALKAIRAFHKLNGEPGRVKVLTREFAYHGVTLATASMTGLPSCRDPFDLPLPGFVQIPAPHPHAAGSALTPEEYGAWCLEETRAIIEREGPGTIAAIFAEPVQGAGGVIVPPPGYLAGLRALARECGALFVADEVITAFGRLGEWFASREIDPDLICLAKGITSGYLPLGATMLADRVAGVLHAGGYFAHGHTYTGHPACAAAALANLRVIERDNLVERTREVTGPLLQKKLRELAGHPAVAEVRGTGLIGAVELTPVDNRQALGVRVADLVREGGVIVRGIRDLIAVAPPLIVTPDEIEEIAAAIRAALDRIAG